MKSERINKLLIIVCTLAGLLLAGCEPDDNGPVTPQTFTNVNVNKTLALESDVDATIIPDGYTFEVNTSTENTLTISIKNKQTSETRYVKVSIHDMNLKQCRVRFEDDERFSEIEEVKLGGINAISSVYTEKINNSVTRYCLEQISNKNLLIETSVEEGKEEMMEQVLSFVFENIVVMK